MTYAEHAIAGMTEDIRRAIADWEGCFVAASRDNISTIVAAERMAGLLCRVQVLGETIIEREEAARQKARVE